ncbi:MULTISPECIES: ImmA/IrrE family metallo-endopeptidase [unclassified Clostridium]|uniref:ImmA/IrrE family metallo-endopeptidase n=1 Tax=unclassified Clostridium TaxID=2614128 RepID=UPI0025BB95B1|nr:ImmA/IrrE family metallo-endopeptidase [Clostridium sp.]MDY4252996.1 ImmA/IrrE family metallo-endopeptidase [Clostridium sp.]
MILKDPVIKKLIKLANKKNMKVKLVDFKAHRGLLKGNRIGIDSKLNIDDLRYTLAHELAHAYLHIDKGDTIRSELHEEYEEQANRTANLIIDLLSLDNNTIDL